MLAWPKDTRDECIAWLTRGPNQMKYPEADRSSSTNLCGLFHTNKLDSSETLNVSASVILAWFRPLVTDGNDVIWFEPNPDCCFKLAPTRDHPSPRGNSSSRFKGQRLCFCEKSSESSFIKSCIVISLTVPDHLI